MKGGQFTKHGLPSGSRSLPSLREQNQSPDKYLWGAYCGWDAVWLTIFNSFRARQLNEGCIVIKLKIGQYGGDCVE